MPDQTTAVPLPEPQSERETDMPTMKDRELLEAAAKAAGFDGFTFINGSGAVYAPEPRVMQPYRRWNPLEDDGDALRLAIALAAKSPGAHFEITISKMHDGRGFSTVGFRSRDNLGKTVVEPDIAAATRRAIVKAAAGIGRTMKD